MREVSSRNVVGQSVLWAFWLVLALAASGCGEGGSGTPTAPRASDTSNAQAASEAVPVITAVAPDPTTIPPTASRFIKISGRNFGAAQFSTSQVLFVRETGETLVADPVVSTSDWSSTQIRVLLLSSFTERERIGVAVRLRGGAIAGGFDSNVVNIQVERASEPVISGVQPQGAVTGQQVTITGASFGDAQLGTATVFFTSSAGSLVAAGQALLWSDSKIVVRLPFGAVSGPVIVARGAQQSNPQVSGQAGLLIAADNTPPVLVSSSPTPNQTAVDPRTSITLVFSEAMGPGATSPANYLLTSSSGGSRTISPTTIAFVTPNSVRMDPATPLEGGVLWTLSLSSASFLSRVADLAGNPLVNLSLAFRTANVPGIPGADQTAPILVSSSPADSSREVDVSSQLVLTFSEPVRFTGSPVSISSSAGDTPQLGTPLATNNNTVFVVRPAANLVGGATYTVSISNAFEDFAGNDFSGGIFRFTTREVPGLAGSDRTPPRLVSSNPSNGSTGVSPSAEIVLIFSEPLDVTTASTEANFRLTTTGGVTNPSLATPTGASVLLQFSSGLLVDTAYTLFLDNSIKDQAGVALAPTTPVAFRTLNIPGQPGDTTPPRVVTFNPPNGAQDVGTNPELIFTFSEEIEPVSLTSTAAYVLTSSGGSVDLTPTAIGKNGVSLKAKRPPLAGGTDYQLILTSTITDRQRNALAPFSLTFRTRSVPGEAGDFTAPRLLSTNPTDGASGIDPNAQLVLIFSERIANASTRDRYTLLPAGSTTITPTSATPSGSSVVLDFGKLLVDTQYTLRVNGLVDGNNNALEPTSPVVFRTANIPGEPGDKSSPTVSSSSPTEGQVVGVDTEIFITFSESMAPATLSADNFRLTTDGGRAQINLARVGTTSVTISPTSGKLLSNTAFQLFLGTSITDIQGNPLTPFTLNFRTANVTGVPGADITPPVLAQTTPDNGDTNVDPFTNILLVFSEPMDITAAKDIDNYHIRAEATSTDVSLTAPVVFRNFVSLTPATITPLIPPLLVDTNYSITLEPNKLKDSAGNLLPPTSPIFFRTAALPGFPGDKQPPTVLGINPTATTSVSTNTEIFVTFSELMDDSKFGARQGGSIQNVLITTSGGPYPIQTATTFAGNKSIMKITPGVAATGLKLLPGLRYDLLLTSGLTDRAGNPLVPVAASFFTVSQSTTGGRDITPPVLVFSNPADGSTNVDPNTKILLTFSEELTTTAKNRSNFTITSDVTSTTPAQDAEVISSPPNSLRIDPGKLLGNTKHSVVLSNAITDKAGNALQPTAFAFTTAQVVGTDQDRTPPVVLSTNPPNNSAAVAIDGLISVTFSKAVNFNPVSPGSLTSTSALTSALNPQNYELFSTFDNPGILTVTQLPFPANTVQLTPAAILRGGTVYNLLASSRIQDAARNNLVSTLISFTTVNQPGTGQGDSTSPQVTAVNPPSGSQVSNPNTSIVFTFSEPMSEASSNQTSSVTNVGNYFVATGCDAGTLASTPNIITPTAIVPLKVPANSYRVQLRSNADDPLDPVNRIYIVELSNRITDRAGNPLTPFRLQFTQGAPPSAPAISFTSVDTSPVPTDTGTNSTFITVQFDRDVADTNGGTLTNNFIVTGIAKDNTEANNHPSDFAIDIDATNTAESSPGVFKLVLKRRPPGTDNDANFRLKKGGSFSLTVVGFSGADSCSQSMSSFKKDFTATGQ